MTTFEAEMFEIDGLRPLEIFFSAISSSSLHLENKRRAFRHQYKIDNLFESSISYALEMGVTIHGLWPTSVGLATVWISQRENR